MISRKKLSKILRAHLVLPVLHLRKTMPDVFFTEKGYEILIENTVEEIIKENQKK